MTLQTTAHENRRLHELAQEYQNSGYEVLLTPTPERLPDFLASFSVDLLAHNNAESVTIEVRSHSSLTRTPKLDAIAKILESRPFWRFELIVCSAASSDYLSNLHQD